MTITKHAQVRVVAREHAAEALEYALATAPPNLDTDAWIDHLLERVGDVYWKIAYVEGYREGLGDGFNDGYESRESELDD